MIEEDECVGPGKRAKIDAMDTDDGPEVALKADEAIVPLPDDQDQLEKAIKMLCRLTRLLLTLVLLRTWSGTAVYLRHLSPG